MSSQRLPIRESLPPAADVRSRKGAAADVSPEFVEDLCWEIRRSFRELVAQAEIELAPLAITAGDRAVLEFLAREAAPISLSDLARKASVSRQHIHQSLRRLPRPGWVEEIRSPDDHRKVLLRLSPAGRAFWKRIRVVDEAFFARLAPRFRSDEMQGGLTLLRKLRNELQSVTQSKDEIDARR